VHEWIYHITVGRNYEWWACKHCGWQVHLKPSPVVETVEHFHVEKQLLLGFVVHVLNHLNGGLVEDEDGDVITCCYYCCWPCKSLKALMISGEADALLKHEGQNWVWWDEDRVSRAYLANGWQATQRHPECMTPEGKD
jgi:hypothetical protein